MSIDPGATLGSIRSRKPLVHNITNYVVMNETANAILALGALPVMAHAKDEVREMTRRSSIWARSAMIASVMPSAK